MAGIINWTNFASRIKSIIHLPVRIEEMENSESNNIISLREAIINIFDAEAFRDIQSQAKSITDTGLSNMDTFKGSSINISNSYLGKLADDLELPETERDPDSIINRIVVEMGDDSQTVQENIVTAADVSDTNNTGNGNLYVTKDDFEGLDNEFIIPEDITLDCINDNAVSGAARGTETFQISGEPDLGEFTYLVRGSGIGPTIQPATASGVTKLLNGTFDDFTVADTPDDWDIDAGVVSTNIFEETSNVVHGNALKLLDVAGSTAITLSQTFGAGNLLVGNTKYSMSVQIDTGGPMSAGNIEIKIVGTGVDLTPISITSSYPTSYTEYQAFFNTPDTIPNDLEIQIKITSADAGAEIYIDDLAVAQAIYHNGVGIMLTRGVVDWVLEDRIVATATNDEGGNIQTFFGRYYGRKLPSSNSPTIDDSF